MDDILVKLEGVSAKQRDKQVLDNVDLEVKKGEFVYIIGKTGSGKSSLLKVLYKELELSEGEGQVLEYSLNKIKRSQIPLLRRKLGIVFQDFQLLPNLSVEENLMFVMNATGWKDKKAMKSHLEIVLKQVDLEGVNNKYPYQLSGGEQQRVVIARAMVNAPKLILADEPTGNLDPDTSREIMQLLTTISKSGTAVLMATHDLSLVDSFPGRVLKCVEGRMEEKAIS
jgi:cell division transport system ATP-binding protein